MILSYIRLALRNLAGQRLYAFINLFCLSLGLFIFLLSSILADYEHNHDAMFARSERIYTAGSIFAPESEEPISEYPVVRTAYGPIFEREIEGVERFARVLHREVLIATGKAGYYEGVRFAEPNFTRIFDFQYIQGDASAIDDPRGLIVTASTARKLFGRTRVVGEALTLEYKYELRVSAVIEDVPADTHFNSSFMPKWDLSFILPLEALVRIGEFQREGDWATLDPADMTYILLPEGGDPLDLQQQANAVYDRHAPALERKYISSIKIRPLQDANIVIWEALGFPILETVQLLGLLVLIVACVNYTNLASAQSFRRTREVGLRKTFGGERPHLLLQFLVESTTLAALAMLLALCGLELFIPAYNDWTGRVVQLEYLELLPVLGLVTLFVGCMAGAYPAYIISRLRPIDSLRNIVLVGRRGGRFRGVMIATQFAISIFILSLVLIIYFQNLKVVEISNAWPKQRVVVLNRINVDGVREKQADLREQLNELPGVKSVSFSSGVPFYETSRTQKNREITPIEGDRSRAFTMDTVSIDGDFLKTYDINLVAGRMLDASRPGDVYQEKEARVHLIVNQLVAEKLGFGRGARALGRTFYQLPGRLNPRRRVFTIVGIMPDMYFIGPQSKIRPLAFFIRPDTHYYASIRMHGENNAETLERIDGVWERVIEQYPIRRNMLGSYFHLFFRILKLINRIIAVFAGVALALALVGLFGLAAFMAQLRTKEIGVRKVMGASVGQIVGLLLWQFSRPVLWALVVAMPLAYFASRVYLDFFPERIGYILPLILAASVLALLSAWAVVVGHAMRIANTAPAESLRYE